LKNFQGYILWFTQEAHMAFKYLGPKSDKVEVKAKKSIENKHKRCGFKSCWKYE
jgi:hypothetical protein